jgi:bifunctional N-acetylglucosamine-1-phosphate-uridyltransferase/glucosamine-1-phosphate-acetyltransferase GlmU-like protein
MMSRKVKSREAFFVTLVVLFAPFVAKAVSTATINGETTSCQAGIAVINGKAQCVEGGSGTVISIQNGNVVTSHPQAAPGSLIDPAAKIDSSVMIGSNVRIEGASVITGNTSIGSNVTIKDSVISDSMIGSSCVIINSRIEQSSLGSRCAIFEEHIQDEMVSGTSRIGN